jgi:hypothetical protein
VSSADRSLKTAPITLPGANWTLGLAYGVIATQYVASSRPARLIGIVRGLNLGGPTGPDGSSFGLHLQVGVGRSDAEGNPTPPSLEMDQVGLWRFRWAISAGTHTVSVMVKQVENLSPRPTLVVKANPSIGISSDAVGTAPSGTGWVTIAPVSVTATSPGVCYVELHNNVVSTYAKCWWDRIVDT